ncbi:MAG: hypothetical protein E5W53_01485, partial [Mesorhizobium sp.]
AASARSAGAIHS